MTARTEPLASTLAAVLFFAVSFLVQFNWVHLFFDPLERNLHSVSPMVFSGDEPHYLILAASLLEDGDILLANNYQAIREGRAVYPARFRGRQLDHHTLIQKKDGTGTVESWKVAATYPDYQPNHPDYRELPRHALPYPFLLARVLKWAGSLPGQVEAHAVIVQIVISMMAVIAMYAGGVRGGLTAHQSLTAAAILCWASPWLLYSRMIFPATFVGLLLSSALLFILNGRYILAAAFLVIGAQQSAVPGLTWAAWCFLLWFSERKRQALIFGAAGCIAWMAILTVNFLYLGQAGLLQMTWSFDFRLFWRTFAGVDSGLFVFAPWTVVVFLCLFRARTWTDRLISAGILPVALLYMSLSYTGQYCYGPRYWVPFLPWMALYFAGVLARAREVLVRAGLWFLAGFSGIIALCAVWTPPGWTWGKSVTGAFRIFGT